MKRWILGLGVFGFVALIGLQSTHAHRQASREACSVCALGGQAIRHNPGVLTQGAPAAVWADLPAAREIREISSFRGDSPSRSPPRA